MLIEYCYLFLIAKFMDLLNSIGVIRLGCSRYRIPCTFMKDLLAVYVGIIYVYI